MILQDPGYLFTMDWNATVDPTISERNGFKTDDIKTQAMSYLAYKIGMNGIS